jgi:imidazoleglycerol-phosphate dehydratase
VEDVGIALGEALKSALSEKRGIYRYGSQLLPMDEALVLCAVDLSGRGTLRYTAKIPSQKIGTFDTEFAQEFFLALTRTAGITLHMQQLDGENSHHIVEAMFKAFGRALKQAVAVDPAYADEIPSTKGML